MGHSVGKGHFDPSGWESILRLVEASYYFVNAGPSLRRDFFVLALRISLILLDFLNCSFGLSY